MISRNSASLAISVAVAALAFGSGPAAAQDSSMRFMQGLYLSGGIGGHQTDDADVSGGGVDVEADTDKGFAGLVGFGSDFGDSNFRVELEGAYRGAGDVDSVSGVSGTGDVEALSVMGNVFYDFGLNDRFDLYVGGGLGAAEVDMNQAGVFGGSLIDTSDLGWAWQLGAGAAYAINERLKLTVDYRFLNIEDLDFRTSPNIGDLDVDYRDHAVFVGLRFNLYEPTPVAAPEPTPAPAAQAPTPQPAPPPPPPPAPEPTRNFLVFFDWDQSVITPEAAAILREASDTAKTLAPVRIVATGHADRSGPAEYNDRLSARRAQAVRQHLAGLGIDPITIATFAKGETDPLVPTPDGVREPQNRRVEIVLQ